MLIIGCDVHSRFQQIAMLDTQTGEIVERRAPHSELAPALFVGAFSAKGGVF